MMSMRLEILVPDGVVVCTEASAVQASDPSGSFGLLPGHQDFFTTLIPCVLAYRDATGRTAYAAVDGGVLLLEGDQVTVVTQDAVTAGRLEAVVEAASAMQAARLGQERAARAAFAELVASLLKELPNVEGRR